MDNSKALFFGVTAAAGVVPFVYRLANKKKTKSKVTKVKGNEDDVFKIEKSSLRKAPAGFDPSQRRLSSLKNEVILEEKHVRFQSEKTNDNEKEPSKNSEDGSRSDEDHSPDLEEKVLFQAKVAENRQKSTDNALKLALHNATLSRLLEEQKTETKIILGSQSREIHHFKENVKELNQELIDAKNVISELKEQHEIDNELKNILRIQALRKSILAGLATRKAQEQSQNNQILISQFEEQQKQIQELELKLKSSQMESEQLSSTNKELEMSLLNEQAAFKVLKGKQQLKVPIESLYDTINKLQAENHLLQSNLTDLETSALRGNFNPAPANKFFHTFNIKKMGFKKHSRMELP